jgi:hypothetical protein
MRFCSATTYQGANAMRTFIGIVVVGTVLIFSAAVVSANPAMLPKHPGYPAGKAVSPVNGQSLANDAGQANISAEKALVQSAESTDNHTKQQLHNPDNKRVVESAGAGQLPKVQGPQIKIEPPVKEATRMSK